MSTYIDEEVARVQDVLKDTGALHTLTLEAFKRQASINSSECLESEEQFMAAFNWLCRQVHAPSFELDSDDAEDLFDARMNFSAFFGLVRDYLVATVRAVTVDERCVRASE